MLTSFIKHNLEFARDTQKFRLISKKICYTLEFLAITMHPFFIPPPTLRPTVSHFPIFHLPVFLHLLYPSNFNLDYISPHSPIFQSFCVFYILPTSNAFLCPPSTLYQSQLFFNLPVIATIFNPGLLVSSLSFLNFLQLSICPISSFFPFLGHVTPSGENQQKFIIYTTTTTFLTTTLF